MCGCVFEEEFLEETNASQDDTELEIQD